MANEAVEKVSFEKFDHRKQRTFRSENSKFWGFPTTSTLQLTASRPAVSFGLSQNRKRAAMRCSALLGLFLGPLFIKMLRLQSPGHGHQLSPDHKPNAAGQVCDSANEARTRSLLQSLWHGASISHCLSLV